MAENQTDAAAKPKEGLTLKPALRQIGTTHCPVCRTKVAVFLARTNRPFVNCGFCSARIFYNGRESMRLLKKKMTPVKNESEATNKKSWLLLNSASEEE